ncbi:hypothetical protein KY290_013590 [Solanum tuberosum]|uniref:Uncharacterized protein n=1 Tax=Solanum tuberosum TaxID=4113 RepID=A0ABQ7VM71_SOLTU|nr:hypothetical protein KY289_013717 [Solanum tuberosum]KAH0717037.1 hypothetical protein KY285_013068 [Solanum tuberosum]KAH0769609.1 hypothetical protein KY290_013590 [Solanum tuberosum]
MHADIISSHFNLPRVDAMRKRIRRSGVVASVNISSFRFSKRLNRSSLQNNWLFGIVAMKSTHSMVDNRNRMDLEQPQKHKRYENCA